MIISTPLQIGLVTVGAVLGALSRWQLSIWLNPLLSHFSVGTLMVNWLGCLLMGCTLGLSLPAPYTLLLVTGFLGSFTTFSAFSANIVENLLEEKWLNAVCILGLHTLGGILATFVGILIIKVSLK